MHYKPEATDLLGTFEVKDGELYVSDPCYSPGGRYAGDIQDAKKGTWNAYVVHGKTDWGHRCWELVAIHSEFPKSLASRILDRTSFEVGVDSGQAGIYDRSAFHGGEDHYGDDGWYDLCCRTTLDNKPGAGVIPGGCVSSTGFGDGGYHCFTTRNGTAEVVGVRVVFISEEDFRGDSWDDEY